MPERTCSLPCCGVTFEPKTSRQIYCSVRCQQNFNRDRADKPPCIEEDCVRPIRAKGLCAMHLKRISARPKDRLTERRRAALRKSTSMRRARERGSAREPVDRNVVADRDGWKCWLCEKRIDSDLRYPDQMSASLDHIVPLSLNGSHTYSNVRIAHLRCNVRRSNKVTDVQLLLVG